MDFSVFLEVQIYHLIICEDQNDDQENDWWKSVDCGTRRDRRKRMFIWLLVWLALQEVGTCYVQFQ